MEGVHHSETSIERVESSALPAKEPSELSDAETHQRLTWVGFFHSPELYDDSVVRTLVPDSPIDWNQ